MIENINKVVPAILNNQIHVINAKSSLFSIYTRVCPRIYMYIYIDIGQVGVTLGAAFINTTTSSPYSAYENFSSDQKLSTFHS